MRQFHSKALVFLLMAAMLAAPPAAQGWPTPGDSSGQPAGCHEDAPVVPMPVPISHQCCQNGHDALMLLPSSAPRAELQLAALVSIPQRAIALAAFNCLPSFAVVSGDPPILFSLRV
jgi:hypothetical protein